MAVESITYQTGGKTFVGKLVYDDSIKTKRPLMLMAPNWCGVTQEAVERTQKMAGSRYIGFVADMYGDGLSCGGPPKAAELADSVRGDTAERRRRIVAAFDTLIAEADKRGIGDVTRKAAVGFCFGGGNVLELARAGADVQAVVCLHGDLTSPQPAKRGDVKAAVLIAHGSKDPAVPKAHRDQVEAEFDAAQVKWQMLVFGGLLHSFSETEANMPGIAEYNEPAARQTYAMIDTFIADAFDGKL
jgi:dienelactone hydrolase